MDPITLVVLAVSFSSIIGAIVTFIGAWLSGHKSTSINITISQGDTVLTISSPTADQIESLIEAFELKETADRIYKITKEERGKSTSIETTLPEVAKQFIQELNTNTKK